MNNNSLKEIANRVGVYANAENEKFTIDPFTILAIINMILTLIRIIYECRNNRDSAKKIIKSPGPISKFFLRRQVNRNFSGEERKAVYNAMLTVSGQLSDIEIDNLLDLFDELEENK
jgi:hypothetical protein